MTEFYLQDSRDHAYVGDGLAFWAPKGVGYVTDLDKAELYTREQATSHRDTDIPWPKAYIDARTRTGVDCQYVEISEALEQYPGAAEFYVQKPKAWNGNNLLWLCEDGVFTSNLSKAIRVPLAHIAIWLGKVGQGGAVAWPCAYIDAHSRRLVERDDVNIKEALRGTGIKLPKPWKPKMMMFNCHGCGRFISDYQRYQTDCRNCGANNCP